MKQAYKMTSLIAVFVFACLVLYTVSTEATFHISTVRDSAFTDRMRPAVPFNHDDHNDAAGLYDCSICHHVWEDGKRVPGLDSIGMECSDCHLGKEDTTMDLIRAYHLQCRGCHMEQKAGPILCGECHSGG
jgi:hypothetical protein